MVAILIARKMGLVGMVAILLNPKLELWVTLPPAPAYARNRTISRKVRRTLRDARLRLYAALPGLRWMYSLRENGMSKRPKLQRPGRNLSILLGRAAAEFQHGLTGPNLLLVHHDLWCPGLRSSSILDCRCSPEMTIEPLGVENDA